eukprot:scaffold2835_cov105-Isochrysis_galbana.AAC.12
MLVTLHHICIVVPADDESWVVGAAGGYGPTPAVVCVRGDGTSVRICSGLDGMAGSMFHVQRTESQSYSDRYSSTRMHCPSPRVTIVFSFSFSYRTARTRTLVGVPRAGVVCFPWRDGWSARGPAHPRFRAGAGAGAGAGALGGGPAACWCRCTLAPRLHLR